MCRGVSGYDPSTDPHYIGSDDAPDTSEYAGKLTAELQALAMQQETLRSPGWEVIADHLLSEMQTAALDLVTFRENRTPAHFAFIQGQIATIQKLLSLPRRVRLEYEQKSVELAELQNPALA